MANARRRNTNALTRRASHGLVGLAISGHGTVRPRSINHCLTSCQPTDPRASCAVPTAVQIRSESALSIDIMTAVWKLELGNSTDKLVLLALADHANPSGHCYPGIALLSKKTDLSKRAIRESLVRLKKDGYVEVIHKLGKSNDFRLLTPALGAGGAAPGAVPVLHLAQGGAAPGAPITVKDPSFESSNNLRGGVVVDNRSEKTAETEVIHRKEPKRYERPLETESERQQNQKAMHRLRVGVAERTK